MLIIFIITFLLLIKNTKGIKLNSFFLLGNYFATIETFPAIKIEKMIKKRL